MKFRSLLEIVLFFDASLAGYNAPLVGEWVRGGEFVISVDASLVYNPKPDTGLYPTPGIWHGKISRLTAYLIPTPPGAKKTGAPQYRQDWQQAVYQHFPDRSESARQVVALADVVGSQCCFQGRAPGSRAPVHESVHLLLACYPFLVAVEKHLPTFPWHVMVCSGSPWEACLPLPVQHH